MGEVSCRTATEADLPAVAALLADDSIGQGRESAADMAPYRAAFRAMAAQGGNDLYVAVDEAGGIVGCFQLTLIPGVSLMGAVRAQIEGVRIASVARGTGLGEQMIRWAVERARAEGAALVQLTSDLRRADAIRFYERLGFVHSHAGMKLPLN